MGSQNEETLSTHPARSETKKVTDKEPTRPVCNTRTWMKTTSYGKTKQHLFVGLLLGVIVLSTQAQALSIEQPGPPICCKGNHAKCRACNRGVSKEVFCKKKPKVPGCERNFHDCKKDPSASGCKWIKDKCCRKFTAKCFACAQGISEEQICKKREKFGLPGCEKFG